jgi:hypothetical protein
VFCKYSNANTIQVDFGQVAQECKIVSKGAAYVLPLRPLFSLYLFSSSRQRLMFPLVCSAKRYERMMRAHGISSNAATMKPSSSRTPKMERRDSKSQISKKRKISGFIEENTAADDEENFSRVKPDPAIDKKQLNVKEEPGQLSLDEAANLMQFYNPSSYSPGMGGDEVYSGNDYDSTSANFHNAISGSYGLQDQQSYDFSFAPSAINNSSASLGHGTQYQPMMQYSSTDSRGGSGSPLIVD